ncbi:hypothetical protein [Flavobacterium fluviatile]|uniref:hypothetical protein n=1 Tax=Flavobacterium fluviatile TaxID=1862387 RepID=UPI0013D00823|nr:hypothetical protein [Flavobacterium fluviatile]
MKQLARILLFIFIAFLATPTVVAVIKKSNNTAINLNIAEEEKSHKEVKIAVYTDAFVHEFLLSVSTESKIILSGNIVKLDNISPSIFAPPPNLV